MVSPQTGLAGGRADLRPVVAELDRLLCADPALAELPGRFLFVLDDGRGDLLDRSGDLGLVALDDESAQLRVGDRWGAVVPLADAPAALVALAGAFLRARTTEWHVGELPELLVPVEPPDRRSRCPPARCAYGAVPGGEHVPAPDGIVRRRRSADARRRPRRHAVARRPGAGVSTARRGRRGATTTSTTGRRSTSTRSRRSAARPTSTAYRPTPRSSPSG